eukprot:2533016-Amphidinium_carterae.1
MVGISVSVRLCVVRMARLCNEGHRCDAVAMPGRAPGTPCEEIDQLSCQHVCYPQDRSEE